MPYFRRQQFVALISILLLTGVSLSAAEDRSQKQRKQADRKAEKHTPISRDQIEAALDKPCPTLDFPGDVPLSEIVNTMQEYWPMVLDYKVRFVSDLAELDLEGVTSLEDITVRDINLAAGSHTCWDALTLIFQQTTEPQLTFVPMNGHILVTTLAKAESDDMLETRIYDVSHLLPGSGRHDSTARHAGQNKGKAASKNRHKTNQTNDKPIDNASPKQSNNKADTTKPKRRATDVLKQFGAAPGKIKQNRSNKSAATTGNTSPLVQLILNQTSPPARWYELDAEGGTVSAYGQYFAIRQTYRIHRLIEDILAQLSEAVAENGPPQLPLHIEP